MVYNKLVRDRIPELILAQGQKPHTRILDDEEYTLALEAKLDEEVAEFHASRDVMELADILEVVYALARTQSVSPEQLRALCDEKREARGGFLQKILLISTEAIEEEQS